MFSRDLKDYLQHFQKAKIVLPLVGASSKLVEGAVKLSSPPFLDAEVPPLEGPDEILDVERMCLISVDEGDSVCRIRARIGDIPEEGHLKLEATEVSVTPQRRRFFRIDAEIYLKFWIVDEDRPTTAVLRQVNLSGSGLRFTSSSLMSVGQLVGLEIVLPDEPSLPIVCKGRVVRVHDRSGEGQDAALELVEVEVEEQDRIVRFCLAEQRKQLRMKVRVVGAP